jgi:tetratricopeptide (TPR) repeat protein
MRDGVQSGAWWWLVLRTSLATVALAASASSPPSRQWLEIHSSHFSIVTDAGEKQGCQVAQHFEEIRAVFGALVGKEKINVPIALSIIAFRGGKELRQFAPLWKEQPTDIEGVFQPETDRNFIIIDSSTDKIWPVVFHEYAHYLLYGNYAQMPLWFDEGFAEYFSTVKMVDNAAEIGHPPQNAERLLGAKKLMRITDLFSVEPDSDIYREKGERRHLFYMQSWLVVKYLYDKGRIPQVSEYLDLVKNQQKTVAEATHLAFGMEPAEFDKAIRDYWNLRSNSFYRLTVPALPRLASCTVSPLPDADAQAVLADAHVHSADYVEQGMREFEEILRVHPDNAAAHAGLGYAYLSTRDYQRALLHFQRAGELNSRDPGVHYYSALLLDQEAVTRDEHQRSSTQVKKELEAAVALAPDFADAYALLGEAHSYAGEYDDAIASTKKAMTLSPRNERYALSLAHYYAAAKKWDEAIALLTVLRNSPDFRISANAVEQLRTIEHSRNQSQQMREPASLAAPPLAAGAEGVQYLTGKLVQIDCSDMPLAVVTVESEGKVWKMVIRDASKLPLIGVDSFSCDWSNQQVLVNYRQTGESEGDVVSLEIQRTQ